jgi:hypothetical protein
VSTKAGQDVEMIGRGTRLVTLVTVCLMFVGCGAGQPATVETDPAEAKLPEVLVAAIIILTPDGDGISHRETLSLLDPERGAVRRELLSSMVKAVELAPGGQTAYAIRYEDPAGCRWALLEVPVDGTEPRALVRGPLSDELALTADGRSLAYLRRSGRPNVFDHCGETEQLVIRDLETGRERTWDAVAPRPPRRQQPVPE